MNYAYFPTEDVYINAGYSIHHVNQPKETFFGDSLNNSRLAMRHIGFLNALLKMNENVILNPNAYYTIQAKASELVLGLNFAYNLTGDGAKQLIGGLYYRLGDAVVPMIGFELKNVRFTFSYDVTMSTLHYFNNYQGATEFSIIKKGFYDEYNGNRRNHSAGIQQALSFILRTLWNEFWGVRVYLSPLKGGVVDSTLLIFTTTLNLKVFAFKVLAVFIVTSVIAFIIDE